MNLPKPTHVRVVAAPADGYCDELFPLLAGVYLNRASTFMESLKVYPDVVSGSGWTITDGGMLRYRLAKKIRPNQKGRREYFLVPSQNFGCPPVRVVFTEDSPSFSGAAKERSFELAALNAAYGKIYPPPSAEPIRHVETFTTEPEAFQHVAECYASVALSLIRGNLTATTPVYMAAERWKLNGNTGLSGFQMFYSAEEIGQPCFMLLPTNPKNRQGIIVRFDSEPAADFCYELAALNAALPTMNEVD